MNIISIDPSINTTGIAILYNGLRYCTTARIKGEFDNELERSSIMAGEVVIAMSDKLGQAFHLGDPTIIIETPDYWERKKRIASPNNPFGQEVGVNKKSIMQLWTTIGAIATEMAFCPVVPISVSKWKGKQSKITREFFKAAYPEWPAKNEHERDAAMMLEWWLAKTRIERG